MWGRRDKYERDARAAEIATVDEAEALCLASVVAVQTAELIIMEEYLRYLEEVPV